MSKHVYRQIWCAYWVPIYERLTLPPGYETPAEDLTEAQYDELAKDSSVARECRLIDFEGIGDPVGDIDTEPGEIVSFDELPDELQTREIDELGLLNL